MIGSRAWRALMWRNLIYRRRQWVSSILEFVLPVLFVGFLYLIKWSVQDTDGFSPETISASYPGNDDTLNIFSFTDYVTAMQAERFCEGRDAFFWEEDQDDAYSISGIPFGGYNWQVPFVKCDSRLCTEDGEPAAPLCEYLALGLAPFSDDDEMGKDQAEAFRDYIYWRYPQLQNKSQVPFDNDFVLMFDSDADVEQYVTAETYGEPENTKLALAVVFDGTDNSANYTYKIRVNSTGFNSPEDSGRPGFPTTPPTDKQFEHFAKDDEDTCPLFDGTNTFGPYSTSCTGQYVYNGFLTTQRLIHDFIMNRTGAKENGYYVAEHGVQYAPFPSPEYEANGFYAAISDVAPLFVTMGILFPVAAMIRYLVVEKEHRLKEFMKMMSVAESDIGWSWYLTFVLFHINTAIAAAAVSSLLYENSSFVLLLIFWILSFLSLISFVGYVAAFFTKATRATLVGMLIFFCGYFMTFIVDFQTGSANTIGLVSLHPVAAFAFGLQEIGRLEDLGIGLTADTLTSTDSPSGYTFGNTLSNFIFDCILWSILSWYANRVVPSEYGRPLPFHFPCSLSYWFPNRVEQSQEDYTSDPEYKDGCLVEPISQTLKEQAARGTSIEIRNLRKSFGDKTAVDGLSMSIYNSQITALLGHNGAGKTTTMNMLSGMMAPSDGFAFIRGKDIRTEMDAIRQDFGICLQHDCLFPNLTVREHIVFFATIKGLFAKMTYSEAQEKIDTSIRDVALMEKRNTLSKNLSGGMKRKLSLAIAFCGDSKTVLLDEPTSGMDPFSRRFTWNVIRQYRQDRCIILTTHFMDEADILGDRIAIMAEGQLRCLGSSLYLKRTYGVGYNLTIEKHPSNTIEEVPQDEESDGKLIVSQPPSTEIDDAMTDIVMNAVSDASLLTNVGTELSFQLPLGAASSFPSMLERLDEKVAEGAIVTYGVGITTLDEVFLLVARGETNEKRKSYKSSRNLDELTADEIDERSVLTGMELENDGLFKKHVAALFRKRAANFKRDKKAWCCTTILPSLFVLVGFLLFKYTGLDRNLEALTLDLDDYNEEVSSEPRNPITFSTGNSFQCQPGRCIYDIPLIEDTFAEETYTYCGVQSNFDVFEPGSTQCSVDSYENVVAQIDEAGASPIGDAVSSVQNASYSIAESSTMSAASQYGGIYVTHDASSVIPGALCIPDPGAEIDPLGCIDFGGGTWLCLKECPDESTLIETLDLPYAEVVTEMCNELRGDYLNAAECENYGGIGYLLRYNFTALHATPLYQTLADEAIVREALNDTNFKIRTIVHPLPQTSVEANLAEADDASGAWFLLVVSFPCIMGAFATFVVNERETKAKHLQTVAGVKPVSYWLSTWLWDVANYQIPLWTTVILMFAFDVETFTTTKRGVLGGVISLLVLFGPAAASFSYCVSFIFKSPSICNLVLIISGFLISYGGTVAVFVLRLIGEDLSSPNPKLLRAAKITEWVLRFFPTFNLGKGLFNVIYLDFFQYLAGEKITVWHDSILLYEVIFLGAQSIVYLLLAMKIDEWSSNPRAVSIWYGFLDILCCRCFGSQAIDGTATALPDDDDVLLEQERVLEGRANDDIIVTSQLSKVYNNGKVAVNNLSFGIPPGQCFGLLGINGAGKTTTMGMLTAEFPPSQGDATLAGFSVTNEPEKTRRRVGYCPQFDAHFANMTGREHIELYASIKGVPANLVKDAASAKLAEVGLSDEDSDRLSAGYSGGMKRRLSLACATIGQPQIVFLDECSTGVDPVARREIWKMISDMVSNDKLTPEKRPSVVLTTHSMEECEALCPRIGIMANGRLRCLGSAQRLKSKFGQGYQVEMKIKNVEEVDSDYIWNLKVIAEAANVALPETEAIMDQEQAQGTAGHDEVFLDVNQAMSALHALTSDGFLPAMLNESDPNGYPIFKEATSPTGVDIGALALFATNELRMRNLNAFIEETYAESIIRERQDTKARYEVSSPDMRLGRIFSSIEENKERLLVAEYGVSQTSLEQVFNMHAEEAEKLKQGTVDN